MFSHDSAGSHFFRSVVSTIPVSIVGKKLSLRAYLQSLHDWFDTRMGSVQGSLVGVEAHRQMPSLGRLWVGSGSEKRK